MISGGIKFFERSLCLLQDGNVTIAASTATDSARRALDRNPVSYWRSSMSNDATTETLTLDFVDPVTLTRLLLIDHNFKSFDVMYYDGASYVHFASVVGIDGAKANITETVFADDSAYYEFASVTTTSIRVRMYTTQIADVEKYINQIIITTELGTLEGYPDISNIENSRNSKDVKMLSGRIISMKGNSSFRAKLSFKDYPPDLTADLDLMFSLWDRERSFLVWFCGGRRGSAYFRYALKNFRLRDIYNMQAGDKINPDYSKNVYTNMVNLTIDLNEAVD